MPIFSMKRKIDNVKKNRKLIDKFDFINHKKITTNWFSIALNKII